MKRIAVCLIIAIAFSCRQDYNNIKITGTVFGTTYSVIYDSETDYEKQFDSIFYVINKSFSTYIPNSDISRINKNEVVEVDEHFVKVFETSRDIFSQTEGAFDPTIGAIVNAWDFGPEGKIVAIDSLKIDSLMTSVSLMDVELKNNKIIKKHPNTYLDFNAIAKGYAVDVIANFLESNNIRDYLVEIGGEIQAKGLNHEKQQSWLVGIDQPNFEGEQSVFRVVSLKDEAMATSGTYRKFKIDENGNRYAHIIDTKSGYPTKTNILSVSVITKKCMKADAYATAFQAMGIEKVKTFLKSHKELKVMIIYENEEKQLNSLYLNDFPEN